MVKESSPNPEGEERWLASTIANKKSARTRGGRRQGKKGLGSCDRSGSALNPLKKASLGDLAAALAHAVLHTQARGLHYGGGTA